MRGDAPSMTGSSPTPHRVDAGVADLYSRFLTVALQEPAVKVVNTLGLSDRYTCLQEDDPRRDGAAQRPLPFDENLQPKPTYTAILTAFNTHRCAHRCRKGRGTATRAARPSDRRR
jgi:GH35 family endo-1,4-beta-xylanase